MANNETYPSATQQRAARLKLLDKSYVVSNGTKGSPRSLPLLPSPTSKPPKRRTATQQYRREKMRRNKKARKQHRKELTELKNEGDEVAASGMAP
ncbi:uncharacterized protein N7484_006716 [Penicillium longicatenatum]|uniref:uncharacterized protein n=1 Tax=Penicillium longicatenatum TaxID=1561947 RepID=UPI0025476EEE|nr:uncharacterized protein N7484_006716 [Penicillium longicatenatum]KAJ5644209.1 hypothetical protein N7484_006716 [Penicillium longicatenatum]